MKKFLIGLFCLLLLGPVLAAETTKPATRTIILVRHGHYAPDPAADEKIGPGLSPLGVAQAHLVAARLSGLPLKFDALHVSPMQRARDTAAAIAANLPGQHFDTLDALAECTPATRRAEVMAEQKPEEMAACQAQLDRVFAQYFRPAEGAERNELFVCHGNVIRYLVTRALDVDSTAFLGMSVGHASITRIRIDADGRMSVIAVGDVGHLPANLLTGARGDPERSLVAPQLP